MLDEEEEGLKLDMDQTDTMRALLAALEKDKQADGSEERDEKQEEEYDYFLDAHKDEAGANKGYHIIDDNGDSEEEEEDDEELKKHMGNILEGIDQSED